MHALEHIDEPAAAASTSRARGSHPSRSARVLALALLVVAVVVSAQTRIRLALRDANFSGRDAREASDPRRVLWSDPALLYYFTERIVEHGGTAPDELRHDPSFEWPNECDAFAFETIGQEYVAAWWHRLLGDGDPLHVSCVKSMAWCASLAAVGIFLLASELTASVLAGGFAALLFALLPSNFRTIGFVLIREDFALPWFLLHLGLLARAARLRTTTSFALCGVALLAALATWHAMGFVVALEAAVVLAWFLRSGENALAAPRAWLVPAIVAAGSFLVPALRVKIAVLSLPMQVAIGLLVAAAAARRERAANPSQASSGVASLRARAIGLLGVGAAAGAAALASRLFGGGIGDYSHVLRLMVAKVVHVGQLPADPRELDFEARLLWQGPFATGDPLHLLQGLNVAVPAIVWLVARELPTWWRGRARGGAGRAWLAAFAVIALVVAWLVERTEVVIGAVAPVVLVVALAAIRNGVTRVTTGAAAFVLAAAGFALFASNHYVAWYEHRLQRRDGSIARLPDPRLFELPKLLDFVEQSLPKGVAVAADMVTSTAILAATRHPVVLQPKYETQESRRRIHDFLDAFYFHTPAEFAAAIRAYQCSYFVLDVGTLGPGSRYLAGLREKSGADPGERPARGSAADYFLGNGDPAHVPGFKLLYRSPPQLQSDEYRVFELVGG
jgi:hypothetical protein